MKRLFYIAVFAIVMSLVSASAFAAKKEVPTTVSADKMVYSQEGDSITFSGQVKVARPDITIWADKMVVKIASAAGDKKTESVLSTGEQGKIEELQAIGNVRMQSGNRKGSCDRAKMLVNENYIQMDGNAQISEGKNLIQGETIKLWINENRSEVVGGSKGRVEATFFSSGTLEMDK